MPKPIPVTLLFSEDDIQLAILLVKKNVGKGTEGLEKWISEGVEFDIDVSAEIPEQSYEIATLLVSLFTGAYAKQMEKKPEVTSKTFQHGA